MSLKKYEAFAKTVELKSLTKAADALGYTQSGMSHMLNSLESELGFCVLTRSRSGVKLTPAGEKLLPKVQELLEKKREIDALACALAGHEAGVVRVGAFTSVAVNWLPGILKEFEKTDPAVEIRMFNGDYHDVEQWLKTGEIDIGFLALPGPMGVRCLPLKEDALSVILPPEHPLAGMDAIPVELAAKEPLISLLETSAQDVTRALGAAGVRPDVRYVTKDDYAIIAMVRAGLGISIMPELLLAHNTEDLAVRSLVPAASRTIALGVRETETPSPAVDRFMQCVIGWVGKYADKKEAKR